DRDDAARAPVRADRGRRAPRVHARGARLERHRDPPLRAPWLRGPGDPARLLHGQPRGRADHVEGPCRALRPRLSRGTGGVLWHAARATRRALTRLECVLEGRGTGVTDARYGEPLLRA